MAAEVAAAAASGAVGDKRALSPDKKPNYKRMKSTVSMESEGEEEKAGRDAAAGIAKDAGGDKKVFEEPDWD